MVQNKTPDRKQSTAVVIEAAIERFLWHFRLIIVVGVVGLIVGSAIIFIKGIIETYNVADLLIRYWFDHGRHLDPIANELIIGVITVVDDFLLGIVLLIFGLGIYDLFVSRIDPSEAENETRPSWMVFTTLDDLKSVLGKVVLMIMIITSLKYVVDLKYEKPQDLLYLGGLIAFVALALKLSHGGGHKKTTLESRVGGRRQHRDVLEITEED